MALVSNREHNSAVIADPAHKRRSNDEPDHRGKPTPESRCDNRTDNRARCRYRLEVIAKENVAVGRHEVHAVHVKGGRGGAFWIRLDNIAINTSRIARVSQIDG